MNSPRGQARSSVSIPLDPVAPPPKGNRVRSPSPRPQHSPALPASHLALTPPACALPLLGVYRRPRDECAAGGSPCRGCRRPPSASPFFSHVRLCCSTRGGPSTLAPYDTNAWCAARPNTACQVVAADQAPRVIRDGRGLPRGPIHCCSSASLPGSQRDRQPAGASRLRI